VFLKGEYQQCQKNSGLLMDETTEQVIEQLEKEVAPEELELLLMLKGINESFKSRSFDSRSLLQMLKLLYGVGQKIPFLEKLIHRIIFS
jgi:hypothetical protein